MNESAMSHQRFVGPSAGGAEREPRMARMHAGRRRKWPYLLLLRKELRQALPTAGLFTLSIVAWHAFLYTRIGR